MNNQSTIGLIVCGAPPRRNGGAVDAPSVWVQETFRPSGEFPFFQNRGIAWFQAAGFRRMRNLIPEFARLLLRKGIREPGFSEMSCQERLCVFAEDSGWCPSVGGIWGLCAFLQYECEIPRRG